jgi:hypothetical protein
VHEDIEQRASAHQTVDALGLDQTELTGEPASSPLSGFGPVLRNDTFLPRALLSSTRAMTVTHPDLTGAELERPELVPRRPARRATFTLVSSTCNASRLR